MGRTAGILAILFALLTLPILGLPLINELEDIRFIEFAGWPLLALSCLLGLIAAHQGSRKAFTIAGVINSLSATACLLAGWEGIAGIIGLHSQEFWREACGKFTPLDLLPVAILPAIIVGASWVVFAYLKKTAPRSAPGH